MERINKLENKMQVESGRPQKRYRVTLTDTETGKIMYQWESYGGIGCSVERVKSFGAEIEAEHIREVLRSTGGNRAEAANILGINRKTLLEKRKRYRIP